MRNRMQTTQKKSMLSIPNEARPGASPDAPPPDLGNPTPTDSSLALFSDSLSFVQHRLASNIPHVLLLPPTQRRILR